MQKTVILGNLLDRQVKRFRKGVGSARYWWRLLGGRCVEQNRNNAHSIPFWYCVYNCGQHLFYTMNMCPGEYIESGTHMIHWSFKNQIKLKIANGVSISHAGHAPPSNNSCVSVARIVLTSKTLPCLTVEIKPKHICYIITSDDGQLKTKDIWYPFPVWSGV